jgi:predicted amidophosphoribosyltransferase
MVLQNKIIKIIISFILRVFQKCKNVLIHPLCFHCKKNKTKSFFCFPCVDSFVLTVPFFHKKSSFLVYYLGRYDGLLRSAITQKYKQNPLPFYDLKKNIISFFQFYFLKESFDIIIPVPKSCSSRISQSFNPAEIVSEMIREHFTAEMFLFVFRKRYTARQVTLHFFERRKKVKDIFFITPSQKMNLENKKILIVDDVYTTGATIEAMIDSLHGVGYRSITIFVLAR